MDDRLTSTIGSSEQALIGAALRGVACRHPEEADELLTIADRIDYRHREDDMGRRGQNIRAVLNRLAEAEAVARQRLDLLVAANGAIGKLRAEGSDEEDRAAEAELEAIVGGGELPSEIGDGSAVPIEVGDGSEPPATPAPSGDLIDQV